MEGTLIKIDKNGTKYYEGYIPCDRCGGAGGADCWKFTGWTCFKCGGTKRVYAKWIERTPEYEAKLAKKRQTKRDAKEAERKAMGYESIMKRYGFNDKGISYLYTGNTYSIKDVLKSHGAKWSWELYRWLSPNPIEDYPCIEIDAKDVFEYFPCIGWNLSNPKCEEWLNNHGIPRFGK